MKTLFRISLPLAALSAFFWVACAPKSTSESISINAFPSSLKIGDTTGAYDATKNARDAAGRMQTDSYYTNFYLVSEDTTVVKVYQNRRVIAVAAGSTSITAKDAGGTLASAKYSLTVSP